MLSAFLSIALLYDLLAVLLAWTQGQMDPSTLKMTLLGNEAMFIEPMGLADILMQMHVSLFLYTFLLLMLFALSLRLARKQNRHPLWIGLGFGSLLADQLGILLTRYLSEGWVYLKITAFFSLHSVILLVALQSLVWLWRRG